MVWGKPKLLWQHNLSGLVASSEDSAYPVSNILVRREGKRYRSASTTTPITITFDAGGGNTEKADYLFISGHNLGTIGATIALEYSTTGAWGGEEETADSTSPGDDFTFALYFTQADKRYWRLKITGTLSDFPQIAIAYWGEEVEGAYCTAALDPNQQTIKANVGLTAGDVVTGIHEKSRERGPTKYDFGQLPAEGAVPTALRNWFDSIGMAPFGFAWEPIDHSSEVYLMRGDGKQNIPFVKGGLYQQCDITLRGRVE